MDKRQAQIEIIGQENKESYTTMVDIKQDRYIFLDPNGDKHFLVHKEDCIEYYKKGSMDMKYVFTYDIPQKGTYKLDGFTFDFMVHTTKIDIHNNNVLIAFELYQENELINKVTLRITFDSQ